MSIVKCIVKGCENKGRYCRKHPGGKLKVPKKIAPRSERLAKVMKKDYVPQVKEMVERNTPCKVKSPVCTGMAQGFHHLEGKENLQKRVGKNKIPCCNPCNQFIEQNDLWARTNGWKLSKHSPNYKRQK